MSCLSHGPLRRARWLVLAPHPDDETIGAGALIAEAAADGRLAAVAYLTDGTGSHPDGGATLAGIRRREARLAIRRLTGRTTPILRFDWRDAHPWSPGQPAFERARARLAAWLRRQRIDAVAVTAAHESHCDHAAAYQLAAAAVRTARRAVALLDYTVWSEPRPGRHRYQTAPLLPGHRRAALCAHRSQLGPAFGDGFRLPPARLRMPACDILTRRSPHDRS